MLTEFDQEVIDDVKANCETFRKALYYLMTEYVQNPHVTERINPKVEKILEEYYTKEGKIG